MMSEESDAAVLVENAQPPGRSSFRTVQGNNNNDGHINEALDIGHIDVTEEPALPLKVSSNGIDQQNDPQTDQKTEPHVDRSSDPHHPVVSATTPVYYATKQGPTIAQEQVVIGSGEGGSVIRTPAPPNSEERPLKAKDIRFMIIFSILSMFCLVPVGLAALYFAIQTKKEHAKGMQTADLSKARKLAKRTEHLIIFSFIGGMVVLAIAFAIVERHIWAHDSDYWDHRLHALPGAAP